MKPSSFRAHHFSISVRDTEKSQKFYELFGFTKFSEFSNDVFKITHLKNSEGLLIEFFEFYENNDAMPLDLSPANNTERLGVKHIGFRVYDLEEARELFSKVGYQTTEPKIALTKGMVYFFVQDPDGNWVEIATDNRLEKING